MSLRVIRVHGVTIQLPFVPSVLVSPGRDLPLKLSSFSDRDLREIGEAWTLVLIEHAKEQLREEAAR